MLRALPKPYLIFLGEEESRSAAKTGVGVAQWIPEDCIGQWRLRDSAVDVGLPDLGPEEAATRGARSLLVGVSPIGGQLPTAWIAPLVAALAAGLDLVAGLHTRLGDVSELAAAAERHGRALHDVRHYDAPIPLATGRRRPGRRLLTVGTDCALGKKYTAMALARAMTAAGRDARFRATGQTGVMIAGEGIAIDAVVADFIAGAAELVSPAADPEHWDVIEGQGAILHPAYAGVTLGLLHGSQPDALVLCHDPARRTIFGFPDFPVPAIDTVLPLYTALARATNPSARFVGIALNTSALDEIEAHRLASRLADQHSLPVFDPLRFGIDTVVDGLAAEPGAA